MTTVFVRDELRASIEAATGGQCTVLYTAQGMPSYFFVLPKFNLEDIDESLGAGTHPAFIIQGNEVPYLLIGMFQGCVKNAELLSLSGVLPATNLSMASAATYARNCGAGFHLMTNAEWAAIALWCYKNGWLPAGNSDWGRNYLAPHETGVRWDGLAPGEVTGAPGAVYGAGLTLTGSGPCAWRHNNQPSGISDLAGNVREWVTGVRLAEGELQVFPNNDAAAYQGAFSGAPDWKAVNFANGSLVTPGTAGTVKLDSLVPASGDPPQDLGEFAWSATLVNKVGPDGDASDTQDHNHMRFVDIESGPAVLKTLGLRPLGEMDNMGDVFARNYGTRYFSRGARHFSGAYAGLFSWVAFDQTSSTHYYTGARLAKY